METIGDDPQQKAAAQELLKELVDDGTMGSAMNYIGEKADTSVGEMGTAGQQMAGPQQTPLAAGVQRGLMNP